MNDNALSGRDGETLDPQDWEAMRRLERNAIGLVAKWWAEAHAQGVRNPESWVARRCVEEIKRAQDLIAAGESERS